MKALFRLTLVIVYAFLLAPLFFLVASSFGSSALMSFPPDNLTLDWYRRIQPEFVDSAFVSLRIALAVAILSSVLGTGMALAIVRQKSRFSGFLNVLAAAPLSVPTLVIGVGLFQAALLFWDFSGIEIAGSVTGVIIGHLVISIPFVIRAVVTNHAMFDQTVEEAALNLGASRWYTLRKVSLPILMPGIISGAFLAFLTSFDDVPVVLFMGGQSGSTTLPLKILGAIEFSIQPDVMALATLIVGMSMLIMFAIHYFVGLERFFGSST